MNILKKFICIILIILVSNFIFKNYIQKEKIEYTNINKTFSIYLTDDWTKLEITNEDAIFLDNKNQQLTIMVQKFPKEGVKATSGAESLDDFERFYKENAIKNIIEISNKITIQEEVSNENMLFAKAEEIEATQENQTSKLFNAYLESDSSFYVFSITGTEKLYDKNIKNLKQSIQTLNEK